MVSVGEAFSLDFYHCIDFKLNRLEFKFRVVEFEQQAVEG